MSFETDYREILKRFRIIHKHLYTKKVRDMLWMFFNRKEKEKMTIRTEVGQHKKELIVNCIGLKETYPRSVKMYGGATHLK